MLQARIWWVAEIEFVLPSYCIPDAYLVHDDEGSKHFGLNFNGDPLYEPVGIQRIRKLRVNYVLAKNSRFTRNLRVIYA